MANRLPAHLAFKSALVLLPPPAIAPPIEAVRRVHDKNFARWPPHINLVYPFLASPADPLSRQLKEDIRSRIRKATEQLEPFHISLSANLVRQFSHSHKSKTVWLRPSTDHVQQLQAALQAEFAECNADDRPFQPHLSIGQASSDAGVQELEGEIRRSIKEFNGAGDGKKPTVLDWYVDTVYVIERQGYHDRFQVVGSIPLGPE